jgi:HD-like signal output (HDOD) protein
VAQADLERNLLIEVFAAHHVEQGRRLMKQWNMPEVYYHIVADHHNETVEPEDVVLTIVRLVNSACKVQGICLGEKEDIPLMELPEAGLLKIEEEQLTTLFQVLTEAKYEG